MKENKTQKMVLAAMFAALTCASTMVIHIPSPANGFVNLGDCFVLLGGWVLGAYYGLLAGGIGSAMADFLLGYTHYVPGTFVIKAAMGLVAYLVFKLMKKSNAGLLVSGICAETIMVGGYFGYAYLILGKGAGALRSIPGNIFQGVVGIVAGCALYIFVKKTNIIK